MFIFNKSQRVVPVNKVYLMPGMNKISAAKKQLLDERELPSNATKAQKRSSKAAREFLDRCKNLDVSNEKKFSEMKVGEKVEIVENTLSEKTLKELKIIENSGGKPSPKVLKAIALQVARINKETEKIEDLDDLEEMDENELDLEE
jgi:hypothetical protein